MANILDKIVEGVREGLAAREAKISYGGIRELSLKAPLPIDAVTALAKPGVQAIAEVKHVSPSKEKLADVPSPDVLAAECEQGGAAVISCLTEEHRLRGSLADLDAVHHVVDTSVLCKDFIVTPYQVHEAHAHGTDLVLLMCSALDQPTLESLLDRTESLDMNALVEAYTAGEVEHTEATDAKVLGISARNLKTLDMNPSVYERLAPMLPNCVVKVAGSNVKGPEEPRYYASRGVDTTLVSEDLVTMGKPSKTCQRLVVVGVHPTLRNEQ